MHTWCSYYNLRKTPSLYKSYNSVIETALSITKINLEKNTKTHSSTITNKKSLKVESELFIHTKNYEIYVLLNPLGE